MHGGYTTGIDAGGLRSLMAFLMAAAALRTGCGILRILSRMGRLFLICL